MRNKLSTWLARGVLASLCFLALAAAPAQDVRTDQFGGAFALAGQDEPDPPAASDPLDQAWTWEAVIDRDGVVYAVRSARVGVIKQAFGRVDLDVSGFAGLSNRGVPVAGVSVGSFWRFAQNAGANIGLAILADGSQVKGAGLYFGLRVAF